MFEKTRETQPETAALLEKDITGGTLPQALLFSGPEYSGRLTAALETCSAISGRDMSLLGTENIVVLTSRDMRPQVESALLAYESQLNRSSALRLVLALRTLLSAYHPALLEGAGRTLVKNAEAAANVNDDIEEILRNLGKEEDEKAAAKTVKHIRENVKNLYRRSAFLIGDVRNIASWLQRKALSGEDKFVILEGVEDVSEGARTALLKTLEEAPEKSYFILITSAESRILPTILSRVRPYRFKNLKEKAKNAIIASYFADGRDYPSLYEFFLSGAGINFENIRDEASLFLDAVLSSIKGKPLNIPKSSAMLREIDANGALDYFLDCFMKELENRFLSGKVSFAEATLIKSKAADAKSSIDIYNIRPSSALTGLLYTEGGSKP